jgi:ABC-2 type transport system permease protein
VSRFGAVTLGITHRSLKAWLGNPAFLIPSLVFPLFFLLAFAGGLSSVGDAPGFDYPAGYTAFEFCFVLLQASAFGGVFTGFGIAASFETGFARRLMLAAPNRLAILTGYALAALIRGALTALLLFAVALAAGMQVKGDGVDLVAMTSLALLVSLVATLFAAGIAFRARTIQAAPAMQMPVFITLFLAPVYVPRDLLQGWLQTAADVNPVTAVVEACRDLLAGRSAELGVAYGITAALVAVMLVWAVSGLRRAEASGG